MYEGRDDRWTMQRLADTVTGAIYLRPEGEPIKPTQLKPTQVTLDSTVHPWYAHNVSRKQAERILMVPRLGIGAFLVRRCLHRPDDHSISVKLLQLGKTLVQHIPISCHGVTSPFTYNLETTNDKGKEQQQKETRGLNKDPPPFDTIPVSPYHSTLHNVTTVTTPHLSLHACYVGVLCGCTMWVCYVGVLCGRE